MGKVREGNHISFAMMTVCSHFWTWYVSAFHSVNWVFRFFMSRSTFMSHATPLSLSNIALSVVSLCYASSIQCYQVFGCAALCSKGKLFWEFTPVVKTIFYVGYFCVNTMVTSSLKFKNFVPSFMSLMLDSSWPSFDKPILINFSSSSRN